MDNRDLVAISINDTSTSYPPNTKLFCNLCNCNLTLLDPQKEEWFCSRCNISYFPNKGQKVKRANKFSTPGPETDSHGNITGEKMPLVSIVQTIKNHLQLMEKKNYLRHSKIWKDMELK